LDEYLDSEAPKEQQTPPPVPPKLKMEPTVSDVAASSTSRPLTGGGRYHKPEMYTKAFTEFMTANPTIFHAVDEVAKNLEKDGYKKLSERDCWSLKQGGKYYVERNGSSLIAFSIGEGYEAGNGAAVIAGHIDALTAKLKPIPKLKTKAGFVQLGVAPYAGALNNTWWDRDLGIGGRVLVKEGGKIVSKLVKLDWPIARIPTLAPHFGAAANGPFNKETEMVPIIGLDNSDLSGRKETEDETPKPVLLGGEGSFTATQPERLVRTISRELNITDCKSSLTSNRRHLLTLFRFHNRKLGTRTLRHPACHHRRLRPRIHLRRPHRRQALLLGRHPSPPQHHTFQLLPNQNGRPL
jgi:aminopeptidase I